MPAPPRHPKPLYGAGAYYKAPMASDRQLYDKEALKIQMLAFLRFLKFLCFLLFTSNVWAGEGTPLLTLSPSPYVESVNVISGEYTETHIDLNSKGPFPLTLTRSFVGVEEINGNNATWHFNHSKVITDKLKPLVFDHADDVQPHYLYDDKQRLKKISLKNSEGNKEYHCLSIDYFDERPSCKITTTEGKELVYEYSFYDKESRLTPQILINKVIKPGGQELSYIYRDHPCERKMLISRREMPDGRYLETKYYDKKHNVLDGEIITLEDPVFDFRIGRVKCQKAPLGPGGEPITTHRFYYEPSSTTVVDAKQQKTVYHHDAEKLLSINTYNDNTLYRRQRLYWARPGERGSPFRLIGTTIEDGAGKIIACATRSYDNMGNIIEEALWGDLTGEGDVTIKVNDQGRILTTDIPCAKKRFRYMDAPEKGQKPLLVEKQEENGSITKYVYEQGSRRPAATFIYEGDSLKVRQFYRYNRDGLLIKTISDDGSSESEADLRGVSERHISDFSLEESGAAVGMPGTIKESYLEKGRERIRKITRNYYNEQGLVAEQEIYDDQSNYCYSLSKEYDSNGQCIRSVDSEGNESLYSYDDNGNLTGEQQSEGSSSFFYDFGNRLIVSETYDKTGKKKTLSNHYDSCGLKIASTDEYGNETRYSYDNLGRLTETLHPAVLNNHGSILTPSIQYSYDTMDNIAETTEANGQVTAVRYTLKGKPAEILYPDGSRASFRYNVDGTLQEECDRQGFTVRYVYDFLGRATKIESFYPDGTLLKSTANIYNAFHLLESRESSGLTTRHRYDSAGRLCETAVEGNGSERKKQFAYDSQGNICEERDWFASGDNFTITLYEHDVYGNIIETSICDSNGRLLQQKMASPSGEGSPIIRDIHYNSLGQYTLMEIISDDLGRRRELIYDALGRKEKELFYGAMGELLEEKEYRYDISGNLVSEKQHRLGSEEQEAAYLITRSYNSANKMIAVNEGAGSHLQRTTQYRYDLKGRLSEIIKPDRVTIKYDYDANGRLSTMRASDGSFHYCYDYDNAGNLTAARDKSGKSTTREYDLFGKIVSETLANGLSQSSIYDMQGRRTAMILPEGSKVLYDYDALYLRKVEKYSPEGDSLYSHKYRSYDLNGCLLEAEAIDGSAITYEYDEKLHCTAITHPCWKETISYAEEGIVKSIIESADSNEENDYKYDELGQLIEEDGISYGYDSLMNRNRKGDKSYTVNAINQIVDDGENRYAYDHNGNLIKKEGGDRTFSYSYDALNRLASVVDEGHRRLAFTYDPFNRRLTKESFSWSSEGWRSCGLERYLYDGDNEIGSYSINNNCLTARTLGAGLGAEIAAAIAIEIYKTLFFPVHDQRGSVRCLLDSSTGKVAEIYSFSAFGEEKENDELTFKNPWRYFSKRCDEESGLILFGQRYYIPDLGRWLTLDPLGTVDSVNRYQFVRNNPLGNRDLYGFFSISAIWESIYDAFDNARSLFNTVHEYISYVQTQMNHMNPAASLATEFLESVLGQGFLQLNGYYNYKSESGTYGQGEYSNKVRITMINGIGNLRNFFGESLEVLNSTHGGNNIHYIFRPTDGWAWDMIKAAMIKCGYVSPSAKELASTWKRLIDEMGGVEGGGTIIHYCHSLGGVDTLNAAQLLTPQERQMIQVITLGSATMIPNDIGFASVVNYASVRDGVCMIGDPIGFFGAIFRDSNIIFVGTLAGFPLTDHSLSNEAYRAVLTTLGLQFLKMYASD